MSGLFPGYLRIPEAADVLGVHRRTVAGLLRRGTLASEKRFNLLFIREDDLQALVAGGYNPKRFSRKAGVR